MAVKSTKPKHAFKKDAESGKFLVTLSKKARELIKNTPIFVAMATDFEGHYCIYRGGRRKITEQKGRYKTPELALAALLK